MAAQYDFIGYEVDGGRLYAVFSDGTRIDRGPAPVGEVDLLPGLVDGVAAARATADQALALASVAEVDEVPDNGPIGYLLMKSVYGTAWFDPEILTSDLRQDVSRITSDLFDAHDDVVEVADRVHITELALADDALEIADLRSAVNGAGGAAIAASGAATAAGAKADAAKAAADAATARLALPPGDRIVGAKALLLANSLVGDLYAAVGDTITLKAGASPSYTYTVVAGHTLVSITNAVNGAGLGTLRAGLDVRGRLVLSTTDGSVLAVSGTASLLYALLGALETGAAAYVLSPAATEADIRAKVALGAELARGTSKNVLVRLPSGLVDFAATWNLDFIEAPNLFVVGGDATASFASVTASTVSAVAATVSNALSTPQYNVTYSGMTVPAGVAVGDIVCVDAVLNGSVTTDWPVLCGAFVVQAVTATTLTLTVPTRKTSTMAALTGTVINPAAGDGLAMFFRKFPTSLRWPANVNGILAGHATFSFAQVNMLGQGATNGAAFGLFTSGLCRVEFGNLSFIGWTNSGLVCTANSSLAAQTWPADMPGGTKRGLYASGNNVGVYAQAFGSMTLTGLLALCAGGNVYEGFSIQAGRVGFPGGADVIAIGGNGTYGIFGWRGAFGYVAGLSKYRIKGNVTNDVTASGDSHVMAPGINASIGISPAANTVGNNNSQIFTS